MIVDAVKKAMVDTVLWLAPVSVVVSVEKHCHLCWPRSSAAIASTMKLSRSTTYNEQCWNRVAVSTGLDPQEPHNHRGRLIAETAQHTLVDDV